MNFYIKPCLLLNLTANMNNEWILVHCHLLPVLKREKGGKGKAEPLKPNFLLILG